LKIVFYIHKRQKLNSQTILTTPVPGTQSALVWVADGLAKLGCEVIVLNNSKTGGFSGVQYINVASENDAIEKARGMKGIDFLVACSGTGSLLTEHDYPDVRFKVYWMQNPQIGQVHFTAMNKGQIDKIVCVSEFHQDLYMRYRQYKDITFVHNGVKVDFFPDELLHLPKKNRIIFAGSICKQKGVHHLLRVMPLVRTVYPDVRLAIAGSYSLYYDNYDSGAFGIAERDYEEQYLRPYLYNDKAKVRAYIELLGALPIGKLASELAQSLLCVVNPNWTGSLETCCNVALEAQAAGIPVVGVNRGALPEVILDGVTGVIVKQRSDRALADAIVGLLQDEETRLRLGRNGRERILREFTYDLLVRKWLSLFKAMLDGKPIQKKRVFQERGNLMRNLTLTGLRTLGLAEPAARVRRRLKAVLK